MSAIPVVLVNVDLTEDELPHALLVDIAEMLTVVSQRDFGAPYPRGWGVGASVRVAQDPHDIGPGEWPIFFARVPDQGGVLGFHYDAPNGQPVGRVFPLLDASEQISVTAAHELFEMLGDPGCNSLSVGLDNKLRLQETGDPVEATWFPYVCTLSKRVLRCSNWVTPLYFQPPMEAVVGFTPKYDWMDLVSAPGQILDGGYQLFWDIGTQQYTQETRGELSPYRQKLHQLGASKIVTLNS